MQDRRRKRVLAVASAGGHWVQLMRLRPAFGEDDVTYVTVNAACAVERAETIGRLSPGLQADAVVWDMQDYRELPYHYGVNLVKGVIKKGKVVV